MKVRQGRSHEPTGEQAAAMDAAAEWERVCEAEYRAARDAKPFDQDIEKAAWEKFQAARRAFDEAGRGC